MKKRFGQAGAGKGTTRAESRDINEFFGKSAKKPNPDDKPRRTPRDRNTGTSLRKKLEGKVIG
ncbi:hypothetical protein Q8F57_027120 [Paraburkholderia terrae]|uniref:hypothetical protein n=1 Tax=Paraburkholderia terrae TaxID=311230 RepID=UPI00296AADD7|nr:hypothetical protein [Paraburkholderia terrae]MDW3660290.1 hypothetical protein [Paraburkholderia terrae]